MSEEYEGLCNSDYWIRTGAQDHWKGTKTRRSPKGPVEVAWNHVSPSQIENFTKCKRLWLFKSILKMPEAQKGHQSLGEAFHLILEKAPKGLGYDKSDVAASPEDWAKAELMAAQALPLLPKETKPFKREHGIRLDTYEGGPTMIGYIDLGIPSGVGWPSFMFPANEAIVADYKTLSDFRYMKTPQELADSVQMMTYAKWAIEPYPMGLHGENDPIPDHIRLLHMYARTKPPFIRTAIRHESAIVTPNEINTRWIKTLDIVREMQQTSSCTNPDDVEAGGALNGHCEAYGGCHFRDKCGIVKASGIKSLFQITKKPEGELVGSAILDKIKAARAAQAGQTATVAQTATSTPPVETGNTEATASTPSTVVKPEGNQSASTNAVVNGPVSGLLNKIQNMGKGQPTLSGNLAAAYVKENGQAATPSGELAKTTVSTLGELMKLASGVVPPDAPARTQAVITKPGDTVVDPIKIMEPEGESIGEEDGEGDVGSDVGVPEAANAVVDATATSVASGSDTGVPAEVKRRGRPSNAELEARKAEELKALEARIQEEVNKRLSAKGDDDLYNQTVLLEREVGELTQQLEVSENTKRKLLEENERLMASRINHIPSEGFTLFVDCFPTKGEAPTDFFEWIGPICRVVAEQNQVGDWRQINYTAKGLLANAIRETIKGEGLPKAMVVSSYAGGADIALEILTPLAKRVIKKL